MKRNRSQIVLESKSLFLNRIAKRKSKRRSKSEIALDTRGQKSVKTFFLQKPVKNSSANFCSFFISFRLPMVGIGNGYRSGRNEVKVMID